MRHLDKLNLRANSKFKDRPDLVEALLLGTMKQKDIADEIGVSAGYISKFKKQITHQVAEIDPLGQKLMANNQAYLQDILNRSSITTESFKIALDELIAETSFIVKEIQSFDKKTWTSKWVKVKLEAIKSLTDLWKIKIQYYGGLSEVKTSAEIEFIKGKIANTIKFMEGHAPELVPEYIRYLDEVDKDQEESPTPTSQQTGQSQEKEEDRTCH